jgi:tyrosine-protein phosphatase SIW14
MCTGARNVLRLRTACLALAFCATTGLGLADSSSVAQPSRSAPAERLEGLAGLKNVARIAPGILRGAEPTDEGLRTLKAMGIRTVINLRHYHGSKEEKTCRDLGLGYERIALASSDAPRDDDVRRFLAIVTDPARQPVYFHCWRGKDRTGTLCAVYRIAVQGWSLQDALAEMDAFGPYPGYKDLRGYIRRVAAQPSLVWPIAPTTAPTH